MRRIGQGDPAAGVAGLTCAPRSPWRFSAAQASPSAYLTTLTYLGCSADSCWQNAQCTDRFGMHWAGKEVDTEWLTALLAPTITSRSSGPRGQGLNLYSTSTALGSQAIYYVFIPSLNPRTPCGICPYHEGRGEVAY